MSSTEMPDCRGWTLVLTGHSLGKCNFEVKGLSITTHLTSRSFSSLYWVITQPTNRMGGGGEPTVASGGGESS
jgi:hypothetical protein